jgi:hypothetical protein
MPIPKCSARFGSSSHSRQWRRSPLRISRTRQAAPVGSRSGAPRLWTDWRITIIKSIKAANALLESLK